MSEAPRPKGACLLRSAMEPEPEPKPPETRNSVSFPAIGPFKSMFSFRLEVDELTLDDVAKDPSGASSL
eukprot:COSAG05_NODE_1055_length_6012_cov_4.772028_3_plen_69_part_00